MTKRLQKELKEFMDDPKPWCKAELAKDENLFLWRAEVIGPVSCNKSFAKLNQN